MSDSQTPSDLLVMFVGPSGPMGESLTKARHLPDQLTTEFVEGKFFEAKSFELEFQVNDSSQGGGGSTTGKGKGKGQNNVSVNVNVSHQTSGSSPGGTGTGGSTTNQPFSGWLSASLGSQNKLNLQVNPCKINRYVDIASPRLFEMCTQKQTFSKAIIVARRAGGARSGPITFFRLEFKSVILSGLDWEYEDSLVTEQLEFYYRQLTVAYAPQTMEGKQGTIQYGHWKWSAPTTGDSSS